MTGEDAPLSKRQEKKLKRKQAQKEPAKPLSKLLIISVVAVVVALLAYSIKSAVNRESDVPTRPVGTKVHHAYQPAQETKIIQNVTIAESEVTQFQSRTEAEKKKPPTDNELMDLSEIDTEQLVVDFVAAGVPREVYPLKPILFSMARPNPSFGRGNWLLSLTCYLPQFGFLPVFDPFVEGGVPPSADNVPDLKYLIPEDYPCAEYSASVLDAQREVMQQILNTSQLATLPLPVIAPSWGYSGRMWSATKNFVFSVFEDYLMSKDQFQLLRQYDAIFTASSYNLETLQAYGLKNSVLARQGTMKELFPERDATVAATDPTFVVFSGGKFEYRKGQDIVVEAVRQFAAAHPEANVQLLAAWVNQWPDTARTMQCSPLTDVYPIPGDDSGGALSNSTKLRYQTEDEDDEDEDNASATKFWDFRGWLEHQGLEKGQYRSSPIILSKSQLRRAMLLADVALFPNRCEAGTNMVASEALLFGIPTIMSNTSGHIDVLRYEHESGKPWAIPLNDLQPATCKVDANEKLVERTKENQWSEPTVKSVVAALSRAYADQNELQEMGVRAAEVMRQHDDSGKRVLEFALLLDHLTTDQDWLTKKDKPQTDGDVIESNILGSMIEKKKKEREMKQKALLK